MKKNTMVLFVFCLQLIFSSTELWGQGEDIVVAVGEAGQEKDRIVFVEDNSKQSTVSAKSFILVSELRSILKHDFSFYKHLYEQEAVILTEDKRPKIPEARYEVRSYDFSEKSQQITIRWSVRDNTKKKEIYEKNLTFSAKDSSISRAMAHEISSHIYKAITQKDSIFNSQIIFVCDKFSAGKKMIKEAFIADFDGQNARPITSHKSIVISPAFSPDNQKIVYALIDNRNKIRNINLYIKDLVSKKTEVVSSFNGINAGAIFTPDGESIMLTLSHTGNTEIFSMNLKTKALRQITRHWSVDVDPSINAEGNLLTFLSSRTGKAMVYTLDPSGTEKNVKRISHVGEFNATPRFSPDGKEIVFATWIDRGLDLVRISAQGENLVRLTKGIGHNEDPSFSPDGQFILFSSKKLLPNGPSTSFIYLMDREGGLLGALTEGHGLGNCQTPRWSN